MHIPLRKSVEHPTGLEHGIVVAIILWLMLAGVAVFIANAWAAGVLE